MPCAGTSRSATQSQIRKFQKHVSMRSLQPQLGLRARAGVLEKARKELPIWNHASEIRQGLLDHDVMLIVGETGSGKSTQVPQMMVEEGWCKRRAIAPPLESPTHGTNGTVNDQGRCDVYWDAGHSSQRIHVGGCIGVTEPRKVAAIALAERVAAEMGTPLGSSSPASKVGFSVRFNQSVSPSIRIKFLTEGMLLQEMLRDPWLRNYSAVVLDEVHERGINIDLLLGFMRQIVAGKKEGRGGVPLKVVVMSATAETDTLREFFEDGYRQTDSFEEDINPTLLVQFNDREMSDAHEQIDTDAEEEREWSGFSSTDEEEQAITPASDVYPMEYDMGKPLDRRKIEEMAERKTTSKATNNSPAPQSHNNQAPALKLAPSSNGLLSSHVSICYVKGRQWPVSVHYTAQPVSNWLEATHSRILQIHHKEPLPGDILCFLTGQETVETLLQLLLSSSKTLSPGVPHLHPLPLFAALPQDAQRAVFLPPPNPQKTRKVILATNIAETSLTVPGIRFVIDSGKAKIKHFRPSLGLESLLVEPISRSAATQRKGRAGREAPGGQCWRLYTEQDYLTVLPEAPTPEILRCDLSQAILVMQARGIGDVYTFPFLDRPRRDAYEKALMQLFQLGALGEDGKINDLGRQMARLPLSAPLARTLLAAAAETGGDGERKGECLAEVVDIIACLSVENVFLKTTSEEKEEAAEMARRTLYRREGDHLTLLATVRGYMNEKADRGDWCRRCWVSHRAMRSVMDVRKQLRSLPPFSNDLGASETLAASISPEVSAAILKCFIKGFASNTALRLPDGTYKTITGHQKVAIHPSSVLFGKQMRAILFHEFVFTNKAYARGVSTVEVEWFAGAWKEPADSNI